MNNFYEALKDAKKIAIFSHILAAFQITGDIREIEKNLVEAMSSSLPNIAEEKEIIF